MYEFELYLFLKIVLIILAWVVFVKSEQIAQSLYVFWHQCFSNYMSVLCGFYKFTFRGAALLVILISMIWLYQPDITWLENLIYTGHL